MSFVRATKAIFFLLLELRIIIFIKTIIIAFEQYDKNKKQLFDFIISYKIKNNFQKLSVLLALFGWG